MRIGNIASSAEYRMDEQFQNFQFLEPNLDFPNWKKISKFLNFQNWTIAKTSNLKNSKNLQFGNFTKIQFGNFQKFSFL